MRSWVATGNNLLNAHDITEGMEHAGGIENVRGRGRNHTWCRYAPR